MENIVFLSVLEPPSQCNCIIDCSLQPHQQRLSLMNSGYLCLHDRIEFVYFFRGGVGFLESRVDHFLPIYCGRLRDIPSVKKLINEDR